MKAGAVLQRPPRPSKMRLTQFTDYALRLMLYVAAQHQTRTTIAEAARFHAISPNHLMKVSQRLAAAGLLKASRGRNGGLALARPAHNITVGDIVRATEEFCLVGCMEGQPCAIARNCRLPQALTTATTAFLQTLDRCSLAQLQATAAPPA
ncbi:Rrf2 family transcriptional regulator, nitric oxide-sensitive transcriptional repressor [Devosia crocina]|uniref:Rrf2 family transcriptional regulator, nitric oxide-sensitive transcriptional repressor n=2 Tax=Devosia crocina TaxID=429728 RepID=A0A1I7N276_9HYPH|nr:Rrf2 family transcriptional regulator, nitric oxide-sensitive transcriptional repressor [Devosia crocina]